MAYRSPKAVLTSVAAFHRISSPSIDSKGRCGKGFSEFVSFVWPMRVGNGMVSTVRCGCSSICLRYLGPKSFLAKFVDRWAGGGGKRIGLAYRTARHVKKYSRAHQLDLTIDMIAVRHSGLFWSTRLPCHSTCFFLSAVWAWRDLSWRTKQMQCMENG